jgi:hypothetical protein
MQTYTRTEQKCIANIRLSSHKLAIEQGRYNKTNRNRRTCTLRINEIEDEMHFILLWSIICKFTKAIYQIVLLEKAVCL